MQKEADDLRSELYGGKNDTIKLISEMRELSENLFDKEELCQNLQVQLE